MKRDPANAVVHYFETVPIETALVVLNIVRGIVTRRVGGGRVKPTTKKVATDRDNASGT